MKRTTVMIKGIVPIIALVLGIVLTQTALGQTKNLNSKISKDLLNLSPQQTQSKSLNVKSLKSITNPGLEPNKGLIDTKDGMVLIQAISDGNSLDLEANLSDLGFVKSGIYERKLTGYLPIESILALDNVKGLVFASPSYKPVHNSGIALTNGDIALKSDVLRTNLGIDGTGNKIGVLSDSYNSLGTADSGIYSGDLPGAANPYGYTSEIEVLQDIEGGSDEGRAMMEIIHDVSPGAQMAFHTAFLGDADFAEGILLLAENGCNIITDDVSYFNEPFFQDGIIAQALDKAVKKYKVSYYSSAGNYARDSYQSKFRNSNDTVLVANPFGGYYLGYYQLHDFDPGEGVDNFQQVTLLPGGQLLYSFQWDEPYASASASSPGSASDLDIFLTLAEDPQSVVLEAANGNFGADPYEILSAINNGEDTIVAFIAIGKWLGVEGENPDPKNIKYVNFGDNTIDEYNTYSSTCFGHSNSEKVQSVGASAWFFTPEFGVDPPAINYFSSVGGTPIYMNKKGKYYRHPKIRRNPDFVAPDGGNTTFFGQLLNDGDYFPNFFGTSAAAPHAAGIAALLNQASNYEARKGFIEYSMKATAIDMDDPFTEEFDERYDFATGYGFLQADKAAEMIMRHTTKPLSVIATCSDNPRKTRNWTIINPNVYSVSLDWYVYGSEQEGSMIVAPGENYLTTEATHYHNLMVISWDIAGYTFYNGEYSRGYSCGHEKSASDNSGFETDELLAVTEVYPNPVVDIININVYSERSEKLKIEIVQMNGSIAFSDSYKAESGFNAMQFNLSQLSAGSYILKITNNAGEILDQRNIVRK